MDRFLAFGPIALSLHPPLGDEGAAAHDFQILMAVQLPMVVWFAFGRREQAISGKAPLLLVQALAWGVAAATAKLLT